MALLFRFGLLLFILQAIRIHGGTINPDDNRTIEKTIAVNDVIIPSATAHVNIDADVEGDAGNLVIGKEKAVNFDTEVTATNKPEKDVVEVQPSAASEIKETEKPRSDSEAVTATDNPADNFEVTGDSKRSNDIEKKKPNAHTFVIPDAVEGYSNNIMLEGHVFGIRDDVLSMIHAALSSGEIFVPVEPLAVHPLSSSFEEMSYEGDKVTSIRYVVSYNGRPVHTEIITRLMRSPKVTHHFKKQLEGRHLRQYKEAQPVKNKSWLHQHLAAVIIPSCVAFILIIFVVVVVVARKRSADPSKNEKKRPVTSGTKGEKKCPPPPYSVENPAYDFETNAVMDGYTMP